jgi:hypothetical protein
MRNAPQALPSPKATMAALLGHLVHGRACKDPNGYTISCCLCPLIPELLRCGWEWEPEPSKSVIAMPSKSAITLMGTDAVAKVKKSQGEP